jgi:hypothetical protein
MERRRLESKRRESSETFPSARQGPVQIDLLNLAVGATGGLMSWLLKK